MKTTTLSARDVAQLAGKDLSWVLKKIDAGALRAAYSDGRYHIRREDAAALLVAEVARGVPVSREKAAEVPGSRAAEFQRWLAPHREAVAKADGDRAAGQLPDWLQSVIGAIATLARLSVDRVLSDPASLSRDETIRLDGAITHIATALSAATDEADATAPAAKTAGRAR